VSAGLLYREAKSKRLTEGALTMVVASDVVAVRLTARPGVPSQAHGTYRFRPGAQFGVLTGSDLPPAPRGWVYHGWVRTNDRWISLGTANVRSADRTIIAAKDSALGRLPEAVEVTLEPRRVPVAPSGPVVIEWAAP
jgi:hypothetical protein